MHASDLDRFLHRVVHLVDDCNLLASQKYLSQITHFVNKVLLVHVDHSVLYVPCSSSTKNTGAGHIGPAPS